MNESKIDPDGMSCEMTRAELDPGVIRSEGTLSVLGPSCSASRLRHSLLILHGAYIFRQIRFWISPMRLFFW